MGGLAHGEDEQGREARPGRGVPGKRNDGQGLVRGQRGPGGNDVRLGEEAPRDAAFLTLMYSSACRLDEVRTIAAGQVHIDGPKPYVTVRGKGGKVRTCYLVPKTARILRAYMREVLGAEPGGNDLLFPSPVTGGPLTERAWDKRIKAYAGKAHEVCPEVPVGAHCHQLRHAKASHWIEDRLNVVEVQHLLGHEQLATTMRYVDVNGPQEVEDLATLSVKKDPKVDKKWKRDDGTLRGFCGLG